MQVFRRWYTPRFPDRVLEAIINKNQSRGQRLLKILPYKEWEIHFQLRKPPGESRQSERPRAAMSQTASTSEPRTA